MTFVGIWALCVPAMGLRVVEAQSRNSRTRAEPLVFEEMRRRQLSPGERFIVSGMYVELQDNEVALYKSPGRYRLNSSKRLREVLAVSSLQETLRFQVVFLGIEDKELLFQVEAVEAGPSPEDLLEGEIETLERSELASELLLELAQRIRQTAKRFEMPELRGLSRKACARALEISETRLDPQDVTSRLAELRSVHEVLRDREFIMKRLSAMENRFPEADEIRAYLIGLDCRKFRGEWITYDQFKRQQGYTRYRKRWVTRVEKDFLETIEAFRKRRDPPILRRRLPREYELLASRGEAAIGMTRQEVHTAMGFPDRVFRWPIQGVDYDLWVFGDQYYYFLDELLLKTPEDDSEIRGKSRSRFKQPGD